MTVKKLYVVGSGAMGSGIAQTAATHGIQVIMNDINEEFVAKGYNKIKKSLEKAVTKGRMTEEAKEEAQFLLDLLEPYDITYPVVLDLEEVNGKSRTDDMTQEDFTDAAIEFLDTVENAGYQPMIYGNLKTFFIMLDMRRIEKYDKWFAYYQTPISRMNSPSGSTVVPARWMESRVMWI